MSTDNNNALFAAAAFVCAGALLTQYRVWFFNKKTSTSPTKNDLGGMKRSPSSSTSEKESEYVPPLPYAVVELLCASRLCFLATAEVNNPHLSLMNFTYSRQGDQIILATRRETKKYEQILSSANVAILIHDFPHLALSEAEQEHGRSLSITLNGTVHVCPPGSKEEADNRSIHLAQNPDYRQFIVGDDIAVLIVKIEKARMCDVQDRVTHWDAAAATKAAAGNSKK